MGNRLKIFLSLGAAGCLSILFVLMLLRQAEKYAGGESESAEVDPAPEVDASTANASKVNQLAYDDPSAKNPYEKPERKRFGGKYPRWDLGDLPEGWNDEVAARLHELFGQLEYNALKTAADTQHAEEAYNAIIEYLAGLGPDAIPTLATILHAEPDFVARRKIFQAVGKMGPEAAEATYALRDFYFARRGDSQYRVSEMYRLVEAMGTLQNDTSFDLLRDMSRNAEHGRYQRDFVEALGNHERNGEATDVFIDVMQNSRSPESRNKAAQALGKVASEDALLDLYDAVQRERRWMIKQTMLGSIGKIGNPDAIPFLEQQARDAKESGVRLSAGSAIRRIVERTGSNYGREVLQELAQSEPHEATREFFQRWLKGL